MKTFKKILFTLVFTLGTYTVEAKGRSYHTYEIKTQVEQYTYEAMVYVPNKQAIKAILIISPTVSPVESIEAANAQYFAKNGYLVIVTYPYKTEFDSPHPNIDQLDSDYYRPVTSAISFINYVEDRFKLNNTIPLYVLGASRGGISTIIITAHLPRVKAAWFAVAGGDLPHIYAYSDVEMIEKFRMRHMRELGIGSKKEYQSYLRSYLKNDPAVSCKEIRVPVHQTIALRDSAVPTFSQEVLANECPAHQILRLNVNHVSGTLSTVLMRKKIKEFFESTI